MISSGLPTEIWRRAIRALLVLAVSCGARTSASAQDTAVSGTDGLRRWHKVTLTMTGPQADEDGATNPFLDCRVTVTFTHPGSGPGYVVPGYFAADGDAADTSATSGNKWRAHLSPDETGNGTIRFYRGSHSTWTEGSLSPTNAPELQQQVGFRSGSVADGQSIEADVTPLVTGNGTFTLVLAMDAGGNDIWFGSDESTVRPELTVTAEEEIGGRRIPGDCNPDGELDLSDATCLLGYLFLWDPPALPCGDGTPDHPATIMLLDSNGDGSVDLSDAVYVLGFLYVGTAAPVLGTGCVPMDGCPENPGCP